MQKCEPIKIGTIERTTYNDYNPHDYVKDLKLKSTEDLFKETKQMIFMSAYASNNSRSDFHWMCDACYCECNNRDPEMYGRAHKQVMRENGY